MTDTGSPDSGFTPFRPLSELRGRIIAACRRDEAACLQPLLEAATLAPDASAAASRLARILVEALRAKGSRGLVTGLVNEYTLSSQEGVALMCLAEALLRIPDSPTRDALIRDKISTGDWLAHLGHSRSIFVNAATWGLVVTGQLTATTSEDSLSSALKSLIGRGGAPVIRKGVDIAMRMMGEHFVTGQTIAEALDNSRAMEAKGFSYSYDMLGEAATTAEDAARYIADYTAAIHAIGKAAAGRGVFDGPGISIKLSALHPRFSRAKIGRVMAELLPRLTALARLARHYDIGLNIDAEEADRLDISLDLVEALCAEPALAGWHGIGVVVQAYQKRAPFVIDFLIDLARRTGRRLMVRLVKGAYWDSEIKRAQLDGAEDFPVFTRKLHTDVSYLACARRLLDALDAVFPQFATHNAQSASAILTMAGPDFRRGRYEFQCLHGMGEPLYEEVVSPHKLDRPCRIYAPVGTHETLLAYLVRRLLENGANSSFVNRIADANVSVADLIADPVTLVRAMAAVGAPHQGIAAPRRLYGPARQNSAGFDLADEARLRGLATALTESARIHWTAFPGENSAGGVVYPVLNPADHRDIVGSTRHATAAEIDTALGRAAAAAPGWAATTPAYRATCLAQTAAELERRMPVLIGLVSREAGKTAASAVAEIREAVDFLRYYGAEAVRLHAIRLGIGAPLGPVVCISPWNFPLAIFTGQIAAALAAGNTVLAKPSGETALIAAEAVRILHRAGIPADAVQLLPGDGVVGAALVADPRTSAVMFTGSTAVARQIQRQLADRLTPAGQPVPLIAETGGQNALVVDSSALAEQVVADVITSAFDSAGQRCSALRILCVQEDVADRILAMLKGALHELEIGNPGRLAVDIGPVITARARDAILNHVTTMRARGHAVEQLALPAETAHGTFVPPTIIEIARIGDVEHEVFGPVLHVLRYRRDDLDDVIDAINATGYGLTFGLHTRIDETIARVTSRIQAGNIYINRNIIGATVGVQPFGGTGLSGTGPKAGGPLYLERLMRSALPAATRSADIARTTAHAYVDWLRSCGQTEAAAICAAMLDRSALGISIDLAGPVGERNLYLQRPRGRILALAATTTGLLVQLGAILVTGNHAVIERGQSAAGILAGAVPEITSRIRLTDDWHAEADLAAVLFEGPQDAARTLLRAVADRDGPILQVQIAAPTTTPRGSEYRLNLLLEERSISTNTAAAGGNASLMSIG